MSWNMHIDLPGMRWEIGPFASKSEAEKGQKAAVAFVTKYVQKSMSPKMRSALYDGIRAGKLYLTRDSKKFSAKAWTRMVMEIEPDPGPLALRLTRTGKTLGKKMARWKGPTK